MCINQKRNKQIVVHPYNGVLLGNKKEQTTDTCDMDKSQKRYSK